VGWPGAAAALRGAVPAKHAEITAITTPLCTCKHPGPADLTNRRILAIGPQTGDPAPPERSAGSPWAAAMGVPAALRRGATGWRIGPRIARLAAFRGKSGVRQLTGEGLTS